VHDDVRFFRRPSTVLLAPLVDDLILLVAFVLLLGFSPHFIFSGVTCYIPLIASFRFSPGA